MRGWFLGVILIIAAIISIFFYHGLSVSEVYNTHTMRRKSENEILTTSIAVSIFLCVIFYALAMIPYVYLNKKIERKEKMYPLPNEESDTTSENSIIKHTIQTNKLIMKNGKKLSARQKKQLKYFQSILTQAREYRDKYSVAYPALWAVSHAMAEVNFDAGRGRLVYNYWNIKRSDYIVRLTKEAGWNVQNLTFESPEYARDGSSYIKESSFADFKNAKRNEIKAKIPKKYLPFYIHDKLIQASRYTRNTNLNYADRIAQGGWIGTNIPFEKKLIYSDKIEKFYIFLVENDLSEDKKISQAEISNFGTQPIEDGDSGYTDFRLSIPYNNNFGMALVYHQDEDYDNT